MWVADIIKTSRCYRSARLYHQHRSIMSALIDDTLKCPSNLCAVSVKPLSAPSMRRQKVMNMPLCFEHTLQRDDNCTTQTKPFGVSCLKFPDTNGYILGHSNFYRPSG